LNDNNYNIRVTFEDESELLIYANRLSNENLTNWKGWKCDAGVTGINIYKDDIYNGECRNDYLGSFNSNWDLFEESTICKMEYCKGCTSDIIQHKVRF
jgi:hypothetical protein